MKTPSMSGQILYQDKLVTIFSDSMLLKNYYVFIVGTKRVRFDEIRSITAEVPSILTGKWRIQGTGRIGMWFPLDWSRPRRDTIFVMTLSSQRTRIGFTVEDSAAVRRIFSAKGLLHAVSTP